MGCDFKPGDEVVCVDAKKRDPARSWSAALVQDAVYTVASVGPVPVPHSLAGTMTVHLVGVAHVCPLHGVEIGFDPARFRKVERRNDSLSIEAFLTIKPGQFEEPKRAPAKKRERVQ